MVGGGEGGRGVIIAIVKWRHAGFHVKWLPDTKHLALVFQSKGKKSLAGRMMCHECP